MLAYLVIFAIGDAKAEMDARSRNFFRLDATDVILVGAVLFVVASLLFFWAFYVRKRPREKHGVPTISSRDDRNGEHSGRRRVRKKRRRHHPDNFPRNPTLGETGGLPPLRPEEPVRPEGTTEPPQMPS